MAASGKIAKGTFYVSVSQMGLRVLSFFSFLIIVKGLTMAEYGDLQLFFAVVAPVTAIASLGLSQLVTSDIAVLRGRKNYVGVRELLRDYSWVLSILTGVSIVFGWFFQEMLSNKFGFVLSTYFWLLTPLVIGQILQNFSSIAFNAFEQFGRLSVFRFSEGVVRFVILGMLFVLDEFTMMTVFSAYIIAKVSTSLVSVIWVSRMMKNLPQPNDNRFRAIAHVIKKHGKWDMVQSIFARIVDNLWPWIIRTFASSEGVAVYAFSQKIYGTLTGFFPVGSVLLPVISTEISKGKDHISRIITKSKKYLFFMYIGIFIVMVVILKPLLGIIFPTYAGAYGIIVLMMTHFAIDVYTLGQSAILYASKKQRSLFFVGAISTIVAAISQISLIYLYGVWGMVYAWLITGVVTAKMKEVVVEKEIGLKLWQWRAFFVYDDLDRRIIRMLKKKLFRA